MPAGRPTKLTPQIIAQTKKLVPNVIFIGPLADCLGVAQRTVGDWLRKGRDCEDKEDPTTDESLYVEFLHTFKKGIAEAEVKTTSRIIKDESWQSAAWILERRFPERWASHKKELKEANERMDKIEEMLGSATRPGPQQKTETIPDPPGNPPGG